MSRVSRAMLCLFLVPMLSGCLADDIWREPFGWEAHDTFGANPDGAQAFAGALEDLGDRAAQQGDVVVGTADDLPNNVVFQNMRDFLNQQDPGRGDQVHDNVTTATGEAEDQYVTLTGPAADAYRQAAEPLDGTGGRFPIHVEERATRFRLQVDVVLANAPPEQGSNPGPAGNVQVRLYDPSGALRLDETFDTARSYQDMFVVGTYGDDNEVQEDLGGEWLLDVSATGEGAWSFQSESYVPVYPDYHWYQFWKADRRKVAGE